jgi:hypothetical protein
MAVSIFVEELGLRSCGEWGRRERHRKVDATFVIAWYMVSDQVGRVESVAMVEMIWKHN